MTATRRLSQFPLAVASALVLLGSAGACAPGDAHTDRAAVVRALTERFETPEPYAPQRLTREDIADFLTRNSTYRPDSATILSFYERREMQYAWVIGDAITEHGEAMMALAGFSGGSLDALDAACAECAREVELRLTADIVRFARRDYGGYFERSPRELEWYIPRAKRDYARFLDALADQRTNLTAIEPLHPMYADLRAALPGLRAIADLPWQPLVFPTGVRRLALGDTSALVPVVRYRLILLGDYDGAQDDNLAYDAGMASGIRLFQRRHGLDPDGALGPRTLAALNVPPSDRLRTILVNMERLRWVPEQQPARLAVVNIPDFRLRVLEGGEVVLDMAIVVGAEVTKTVVFADTITSVTFSPTWTVPASITRKEILPAMRRDPRYLARNQMEIIGGTAELPLIRQRPGPHNALGLVKFSFPNPYGIFMHDTPARGLFASEQRAFSHGCIRVEQPLAMAQYLLRDDSAWTNERMQAAMRSGRETVVRVRSPLPVMLVYFTAWIDRDGALHFRDDVYGHDARLAGELFAGSDAD